MPINRIRQGSPPDGGPDPGAKHIQIGEWWLEYRGQVPTQQDLDDILNPVIVTPSALVDGTGEVSRSETNNLKAFLRELYGYS